MKKRTKSRNVKQNTPIVLIVVISTVFFLVGFGTRMLYANIQNSRAESVASEFIDHILEGSSDEAYQLTSSNLQEVQPEDEFIAVMDGLEAEDPQMPIEPTVIRSDNTVIYNQYVTGLPEIEAGDDSGAFNISLIRENREWRVNSVNIE